MGCKWRSQTSSFMLKDRPRDLADIGRRLNVNLVVEGDAQLSGNRLLINAALVSIEDDRREWSGKVDRQLSSEGDVVGVVKELTREIVNELRLKLGRTQRRYKTDIPTYELYRRALALREVRMQGAKAIPLFEDVLTRDPSYAPALAALALAHGDRSRTYPDARGTAIPPSEADARAEPLAQQALAIDPLLAEAHAAIGGIHARAGRWAQAEESFRYAISLQPELTYLYGSFALTVLHPWGRLDEALNVMQDAVRADPLSLGTRVTLGRVQIGTGHYDDALANCTRVLEQDPEYSFAEEICGTALIFKGRTDKALALFNNRSEVNEHWIGYIYAVTGRRAEAEALAARNAHLPHRPAIDVPRPWATRTAHSRPSKRWPASTLIGQTYCLEACEASITLHDDPRAAVFRQKLGLPPVARPSRAGNMVRSPIAMAHRGPLVVAFVGCLLIGGVPARPRRRRDDGRRERQGHRRDRRAAAWRHRGGVGRRDDGHAHDRDRRPRVL